MDGGVQVRSGRGFTLEELKEAGIPKKLAPTIGICVDHRRKNRSLETLQTNAARLKAYKASLVVFPRRSKKPKAGDATAEELQKADQCTTTLAPITKAAVAPEFVALTADMKVRWSSQHSFSFSYRVALSAMTPAARSQTQRGRSVPPRALPAKRWTMGLTARGCMPVQATKAYGKLRVERMNKRQMGIRKKRAEEEAAAAKDKAKLGA